MMDVGDPAEVTALEVTVLLVRSPRPWWALLRALMIPSLYRIGWRMWRERPALLAKYPQCDWRWLRVEQLP